MTKCCPQHPAAANRAERRVADRYCPCRGECNHHPAAHRPARKNEENTDG